MLILQLDKKIIDELIRLLFTILSYRKAMRSKTFSFHLVWKVQDYTCISTDTHYARHWNISNTNKTHLLVLYISFFVEKIIESIWRLKCFIVYEKQFTLVKKYPTVQLYSTIRQYLSRKDKNVKEGPTPNWLIYLTYLCVGPEWNDLIRLWNRQFPFWPYHNGTQICQINSRWKHYL